VASRLHCSFGFNKRDKKALPAETTVSRRGLESEPGTMNGPGGEVEGLPGGGESCPKVSKNLPTLKLTKGDYLSPEKIANEFKYL
jgi:hypothetical protein